jgi:hypothetical protein
MEYLSRWAVTVPLPVIDTETQQRLRSTKLCSTLKEEMYKSICCQDITWRSYSFLNENEVAHFTTFMQLSHDKTSVDDGRKSYPTVIYMYISVSDP